MSAHLPDRLENGLEMPEVQARLLSHLQMSTNPADGDNDSVIDVPINVDPLSVKVNSQIQHCINHHKRQVELITQNDFLYHALQREAYSKPKERSKEYFLSPDFNPLWLSENTRKVFFDIETLHLPNNAELAMYATGSTNYVSKQRLGACVSIDEKGEVKCWDEQCVLEFIEYLLSYEEVISFNGMSFDNQVLSGYANAEQMQQITNRTFDLMLYLEMRDGKRRRLDTYAQDLLNKRKLSNVEMRGNSRNVPKILREGSPNQKAWVWKYCFWDTNILKDIYESVDITLADKARFFCGQVESLDKDVCTIARSIIHPAHEFIDGRLCSIVQVEQGAAKIFFDEAREMCKRIFAVIESSPEECASCIRKIFLHQQPITRNFWQPSKENSEYSVEERIKILVADQFQLADTTEIPRDSSNLVIRLLPAKAQSIATVISGSICKMPIVNRYLDTDGKCAHVPKSILYSTNIVEKIKNEQCSDNLGKKVTLVESLNGQTIAIVDAIQINNIQHLNELRIQSGIKKIYYNSISKKGQDSLNELGLQDYFRLLSREQLIAEHGLQSKEDLSSDALLDSIQGILAKMLPSLIKNYQIAVAVGAREPLQKRLAALPTMHLPSGEESQEWIREIYFERFNIEFTIQCIDSILQACNDTNMIEDIRVKMTSIKLDAPVARGLGTFHKGISENLPPFIKKRKTGMA